MAGRDPATVRRDWCLRQLNLNRSKTKSPPVKAGFFVFENTGQQPAASFSCDAGLKRKPFDALILIASPVRGLRPMRGARLDTVNVPKVPIWYLPPFFT